MMMMIFSHLVLFNQETSTLGSDTKWASGRAKKNESTFFWPGPRTDEKSRTTARHTGAIKSRYLSSTRSKWILIMFSRGEEKLLCRFSMSKLDCDFGTSANRKTSRREDDRDRCEKNYKFWILMAFFAAAGWSEVLLLGLKLMQLIRWLICWVASSSCRFVVELSPKWTASSWDQSTLFPILFFAIKLIMDEIHTQRPPKCVSSWVSELVWLKNRQAGVIIRFP